MLVHKIPFNAQSNNDKKPNIFLTTRCCLGHAIFQTNSSFNNNTAKGSDFGYLYLKSSFIVYDWSTCRSASTSLKRNWSTCGSVSTSLKLKSPPCGSASTSLKRNLPPYIYASTSLKRKSPPFRSANTSLKRKSPPFRSANTSLKLNFCILKIQDLLFTTFGQESVLTAFILKHHGAIF